MYFYLIIKTFIDILKIWFYTNLLCYFSFYSDFSGSSFFCSLFSVSVDGLEREESEETKEFDKEEEEGWEDEDELEDALEVKVPEKDVVNARSTEPVDEWWLIGQGLPILSG